MKQNRTISMRISRFAFVLLIVLLAAACGAQPTTLDQLPTYPGATGIQPGQNNLADSVASAMQESADQQGLNAQFRLFSLPAGTTWDDVKAFYTQQMDSLHWKQEQAMTVEGEGFQAAGWSEGTGSNQQALMVGFVPDVNGQGAFAILGLMSK